MDALAEAFRADGGRVLAALIAQFRDFDLAEEALADAAAEAARAWDRPPETPGAWLLAVARRRALDRLRRRRDADPEDVAAALHPMPEPGEGAAEIPDERLRLIFTCCHPALAPEAQVALTLRTLAGLSTAEIARAHLVPEATMGQRLSRAKRKIREAAIPYAVPEGAELAPRLEAVLAVLYLIFNEGHAASAGEAPIRADLTAEAIRLARILHGLLPEPEVGGLLALMLLNAARHPARLDGAGELVGLARQDRGRWDRAMIAEGTAVLHHAFARHRPGPYQLQAAIAAAHSVAPDWAATDWPHIAGLYAALARFDPSPVVALNHAVAVAEAGDPGAALAMLDPLAGALARYAPFFAARAELRRRTGAPGAEADFAEAMALSGTEAERRYLAARAAEGVLGDNSTNGE
ncbi:MAG: DUF6596 domain-containing protein [Pseudomonadota bacterium]